MRETAQGMIELYGELWFVITNEYGQWEMKTAYSSITYSGCFNNFSEFVTMLRKVIK